MNDSSNRDVAVFTGAIQLPVGERTAYLDRACAGNRELRQKVEALLASHDQAGDFLENSPNTDLIPVRPGAPVGEKPGDYIGRYKLLQQIGEGGCGVVFMAEQEEPVRRRVALKIIKPGMDTKSVIARFEAERQALALMDHPNIAKILDAGATDSGRPYFVMELVRGIKITDYCDQHLLTTRERLELFIQVCRAVQHAHQKGIIHRDIKPSNILVTTTSERAPLPVVIDFGIAKATTNQRLTDKTLFTAFEMLIGTPAYMSPEQAELTSVGVDTRTDIYSLGVLLYELLTGSTPFDTRELLKAGLDEIRRVIREEEPVSPSTRLSRMTSDDLTVVARHCQAEPPKLIRAVCGDLDWIALKALEKDRSRRYETAMGLALDVQRFLDGEAISAHPPSTFYKFKKIVLRNRLLFAAIAVVAVLLIVSLIVVSASLAKERKSRRDAEAAKAAAEAASDKSRQVTQFLEDMLNGVGPAVALGQDTTMLRGILDRTAARVGSEMTDQPAVAVELASLIGGLYEEIGNYDQAEKMHREALAIDQKLFGSESAATATALNNLALALVAEEKLSDAEKADAEALAIRERLLGKDNADTATSLNDLGAVYRQEGRLTEAEAMAREALAIREKLFGKENLAVADSLRNLGIILGDEQKWPESEAMARQVLALRRTLLGPDHPWVATALDDLAWAAGGNGKNDEAEKLQLEALALRQKLLPNEHRDVAKSLHLVGDSMREQGKLDAAYSVLSAALSIQSKLLGDDDPAVIGTLHSMGQTLEDEGKYPEAEGIFRQALALRRKHGGNADPATLSELESFCRVLMDEKRFGEAEQLVDQTLTPDIIKLPYSANLLGLQMDLEARQGQWAKAAANATQSMEHDPANHQRFPVLAALYIKIHDRPAYDQLRRRLLDTFGQTTDVYVADQVAKACLFLPPSATDLDVIAQLSDLTVTQGIGDHNAMPYFQDCKALCEYRQGHYAEAAEWAQKPLTVPGLYVHGHAYAVLAMADWQLGDKNEARVMLAKGNALDPAIMPATIAQDHTNAWLAWLYARIQLDEATALIDPASKPAE